MQLKLFLYKGFKEKKMKYPSVRIFILNLLLSLSPLTRTQSQSRTVIFMWANTSPGDYIFLRGGISNENRPDCTVDAETDPCAIDIRVRLIGTNNVYEGYNLWKVGDTKFDWHGLQAGQSGMHNGIAADGTPSVFTSNDVYQSSYQALNVYGEGYWMVDMDMDCSQTENGWFEMKALRNGVWEPDIMAPPMCQGTAGGSPPYTSTNHFVRCGYINVFEYGVNGCIVDNFP